MSIWNQRGYGAKNHLFGETPQRLEDAIRAYSRDIQPTGNHRQNKQQLARPVKEEFEPWGGRVEYRNQYDQLEVTTGNNSRRIKERKGKFIY